MPIVCLPELVFQPHPSAKKFRDITGQQYGRLTVLGYAGRIKKKQYWYCECTCGNFSRCGASNLKSGESLSCGCYNREQTIKAHITHGMTNKTPEYGIWMKIIARCTNPNDHSYNNYGGRGITICERWRHNFKAFLEDMGPRPSPEHSVDRFPDHNGNYEPSNCRWATIKEQARNKRSNRLVTYRGKEMCLSEACELAGIDYKSTHQRISKLGWSVERALSTKTTA